MLKKNKTTKIILHVFNDQKKFSKPFFDFLNLHDYNLSSHILYHYGKHDSSYNKYKFKAFKFSSFLNIFSSFLLLKWMFRADKIFIHSLASPYILLYLYLFPKLSQKVYWFIWGKDLYFYQLLTKKQIHHKIYEYFRKKVIKQISHVVTYIKGDYLLAQNLYNIQATFHESLMYPSNIFKGYDIQPQPHGEINILAGNSADPSNNHFEILKKLEQFKHNDIKIYSPLSYGGNFYAQSVIKKGKQIFGDKFIPITELMPFEAYMSFLGSIDIAIFAHKRQQAMGNIISLLGYGKKVYIRKNITPWTMFKEQSIKVFDFDKLSSLEKLPNDIILNNIEKIKKYFSKEKYIEQLDSIIRE